MIDVDNQFNPDKTKKKLLKITDPIITIDGSTSQIESGRLGYIQIGTSIDSVIFGVSVYDAFTGNITTLEDSEYTYTIDFSILPDDSSLPLELTWSGNSYSDLRNTLTINGIITEVSKEKYEFLVRASLNCYENGILIRTDNTDYYCYFESLDNSYDYHWNKVWINSLPNREYNNSTSYDVGIYDLGSIVNTKMEIDNLPDDIVFQESILSSNITFQDLGLTISKSGYLSGTISLNSTSQRYYFKISSSRKSNSNDNGYPPLENTIFSFLITDTVTPDDGTSDTIIWNTDTNLGSQYETYPSFFTVSASSLSKDTVKYIISPISTSYLPSNLSIDLDTGSIIGLMPHQSIKTTYSFTVRAYTSTVYSDKTFTFIVMPFYFTDEYVKLEIPVTDEIRRQIAVVSWDTDVIPQEYVYKIEDDNFGRCRNQNIYLVSGLKDNLDCFGYWDHTLDSSSSDYGIGVDLPDDDTLYSKYSSCFLDKLMNYHHPYDVEIKSIEYANLYDSSGNHICDVIYYLIDDNRSGVGGFDSYNHEVLLVDNNIVESIPEWNMPSNSYRICPVSINNTRKDLILTSNRISSPTYSIRPNAVSGIGLVSKEGLPMWMLNSSPTGTNIGFIPAIEICYVKAGYGKLVTERIKTSSYYNVIGKSFTVDRYIVYRNEDTKIHFDLTTTSETTFDCTETNGIIDKTTGTWFDVVSEASSSVIKFPPGDIG